MAGFSMRIVDADFYLAKPVPDLDICYSGFKQTMTKRVPVVRIFGATAKGQKTCLHIHQLFPYIYVRISEHDASGRFAKQFATSLDVAIQIALGKTVSSDWHSVHEVDVVKGFTFYGFHDEEEHFLKISVYNPNHINMIEELLLNGTIMGRVFQPYEGHIPFLLQFFIDCNLYGMNYINLAAVKFRLPVLFVGDFEESLKNPSFASPVVNKQRKSQLLSPLGSPSQTCYETWLPENLSREMLMPAWVSRQSTCLLEVDAIAADILNKNDVKDSLGSCPGLVALWQEEKQRRILNNESADISAAVSQGERQRIIFEPERRYLEDFQLILKTKLKQKNSENSSPVEEPFLESPNLISGDTPTPEDQLCNKDVDFDESRPIVDEEAIRQSLSQVSFIKSPTSPRQKTAWTTMDEELLDFLLMPSNDQETVLTQMSSISNGVAGDEMDSEVLDQLEEDDMNETIMMSQHVYDDICNDNGDEVVEEVKKEAEKDKDDIMDFSLNESWSSSWIKDIPQIDGTYDIEDLSQSNKKQHTVPVVSPCEVYQPADSHGQGVAYHYMRSLSKPAHVIAQLDGSSDSDFLEDSFLRKRGSKYQKKALKTYDKSARKKSLTLRTRVTSSKADGDLKKSASSKRKGIMQIFSNKNQLLFGHGDSESNEENSNGGCRPGLSKKSFTFEGLEFDDSDKHLDAQKTVINREATSPAAAASSLFNAESQEIFIVSPTDPRTSSSKRFSLRSRKDSRKVALSTVSYKHEDEPVSFDEKSTQRLYHRLTLSGNAKGMIGLPDKDANERNLDASFSMAAVDVGKKCPPTMLTDSVSSLDSDAMISQPLQTYSSLIRDCCVSLVDVRATNYAGLLGRKASNTSSILGRMASSASSKRKLHLSVSKSCKKVRYTTVDSSSRRFNMTSHSGLKLEEEKDSNVKQCETCSDFLFRSRFPSQELEDFNLPQSPPRPTSPYSDPRCTGSTANGGVSAEAIEEEPFGAESDSVNISFHDDRFPAQIKPVKLNYDILDASTFVTNSRSRRAKQRQKEKVEASNQNVRVSRQGEHPNVDGTRRYLECDGNSMHSESVTPKPDVTEVSSLICHRTHTQPKAERMEKMTGSLESERFEYCVDFSPIVAAPEPNDNSHAVRGKNDSRIERRTGFCRLRPSKLLESIGRQCGFLGPTCGNDTQNEGQDVSQGVTCELFPNLALLPSTSTVNKDSCENLDIAEKKNTYQISDDITAIMESDDLATQLSQQTKMTKLENKSMDMCEITCIDDSQEGEFVISDSQESETVVSDSLSHRHEIELLHVSSHQNENKLPDVSSHRTGTKLPLVISRNRSKTSLDAVKTFKNEELQDSVKMKASAFDNLEISFSDDEAFESKCITFPPKETEKSGLEDQTKSESGGSLSIKEELNKNIKILTSSPNPDCANMKRKRVSSMLTSVNKISSKSKEDFVSEIDASAPTVPRENSTRTDSCLKDSTEREHAESLVPLHLQEASPCPVSTPSPGFENNKKYDKPAFMNKSTDDNSDIQDASGEPVAVPIIASSQEYSPCASFAVDRTVLITPLLKPPTRKKVLGTAFSFGLGETRNQQAFFGNSKDIPSCTKIIGGRKLRIDSVKVSNLPSFKTESGYQGSLEKLKADEDVFNTTLYQDLHCQAMAEGVDEANFRRMIIGDNVVAITPCRKPPSMESVRQWLEKNTIQPRDVIKTEPISRDLKNPVKYVEKDHVSKSPSLKSQECAAKNAKGIENTPEISKKALMESPTLSPSFPALGTVTVTPSAHAHCTSTPLSIRKRASQRLRLPGQESDQKSKPNTSTPLASVTLKRSLTDTSQIDGPTPANKFGFGFTQVNYDDARNAHEVQHLTILSIELHVKTRRDLCPDPGFDPICAIFYHVTCDTNDTKETGIFLVDLGSSTENCSTAMTSAAPSSAKIQIENTSENVKERSVPPSPCCDKQNTFIADKANISTHCRNLSILNKSGITDYTQRSYADEKSMIIAFQSFVRFHDPDMLIGYEIQMLSWGYLIDRAKELDILLCPQLSRIPGVEASTTTHKAGEIDELYGHANDVKISGRILLNVWRIMRSEVTLRVYSFESVAFHVLHRRLPKYSFRTLSSWWSHQTSLHRRKVVEYYITRCRANVEMLVRTDFISRTSELARLFGILFYSVISRGSQFRVESMMLRIAKPMGFIPVSPSVRQRAQMAAPEVIPLVMEPESRFYTDPVLVLDFQSLYPSIIIAYNYCFSTCLGRVSQWSEPGAFKFGTTSLSLPTSVLQRIKDDIHVSPNGVGFVKSNIRKGILPRMLDDILKTRIMVKNSMKKNKNNKALHRMLDARQLGLKLIANVTYGYTSANFSGRMPCVEIADSVVRKGREALETAINLINSTERWNARVVYGDTDSVFVLLKGATKKTAFDIGNEIVNAVTKMNPQPMKLKFEKVYMPCILQTKKRYVGYMYETLDQKEPVFDAKGIETVRRDSCAAVSKILERSLKTLFETKDLSLVKKYTERQFTKIMEGRVSIQDLTFAKEYRGMKNYKPGACVPALAIASAIITTWVL
ncbi:DNA polymerase zeta catalytic subunit-like isoform X2 [Rhopilema esculentum]|uniref:DNA polymerase zeta catalytic subunit-like isoform X2 n=1 Tax=Rhopilema esculentum TaxID=499914 RepID=UPI0031DF0CBB